MEDQEMQLKVRRVTDKFTESMYVLANEPSVALYRLQEHVRRSLPELVQHKTDMQSWEEQSQGAIYTVEYACSAVKSMTNSSMYFKNIDSLLRQAISLKEQISNSQGRSCHDVTPPPSTLVSALHAPPSSSCHLNRGVQGKGPLTLAQQRKVEKSTTLGCDVAS
ncbi:BLOC-1-related complex subunit 8 isoform X1 [Pleuronectes platessa]|nr:BLOC-1-related complex subunit 8 isoform X1 [Pleuronectes platessa]